MDLQEIKRLCPEFESLLDYDNPTFLKLLHALAEARHALEWRPIESAPTDHGGIILLGSPNVLTETGWRSKNEPDSFENEYGFINPQPTHWMPLPTPPSGTEGKAPRSWRHNVR